MWKDDLPPNRATTTKELEDEDKTTDWRKLWIPSELIYSPSKDCFFKEPDFGYVPNYPPPLEGNENITY
jgi:hypothetical protein